MDIMGQINTTDIVRVISTALALSSIFPTFAVIRRLVRERAVIDTKIKPLNKFLTALFLMIAFGSFYNASISILLLLDVIHNGAEYAIFYNTRNIITNVILFFVTWGFYTQSKNC